jgi:solute carrier family 50 (sugar transporter)
MPYIYSLLNCLICMWYGLPFVSYGVVLVATVNSVGAAFQLAYSAVFIAFAADAKQRVGRPYSVWQKKDSYAYSILLIC